MELEYKHEHSANILDTILNILRAAEGGARETHLTRQYNLSFRRLNTYLDFLVDMSFLERVNTKTKNKRDSQLFKTTSKGKAFLKDYHNLKEQLIA